MTSRTHFAIPLVAALAACGGSFDRDPAAAAGEATPELILDPTVLCYGPACLGVPMETLRLAPPAPPVIPTRQLVPVQLPTLPLPVVSPIGGAPAGGGRALRIGDPGTTAATTPPPGCTSYTLQMQVLVISADGKEPELPAVHEALGYHTVPFTTWIATANPGTLTADKLAAGCAGKYQGVVLTTGALAFSPDGGTTWQSALSAAEWQALRTYEANFHVREISWYVFPGSDQGMNPPTSGVDTTTTPIDATLTAAGKAVFPYVNAANPVPIRNAWTYRATASDPNVVPLLLDSANNVLMATRVTPDGRETLFTTFDSNQFLIHDLILAHGLVEWLTTGVYLGEFRSYLTPQVDDLLIDNDMFVGGVFRISAADYNATRAWQDNKQIEPGNLDFLLTMAFNGEGGAANDPLTTVVRQSADEFYFINHTFTHENLDTASYDLAFAELKQNIDFATAQGYAATGGNFSVEGFVSPDVSGLNNVNVLNAALDNGIFYMVSDSSRESGRGNPVPGNNPAPNIGNYSTLQPEILFCPRKPTNLFYNVSTPTEWTNEYNAIYRSFWGRDLTYAEILDKESENLLVYMLQGNIDTQMYHQANLRAYDGVHSLLSDLHDAAIAKFRRHFTLPLISVVLEEAGSRMADTMGRNESGVVGTLKPGASVTFTTVDEAWFAVTGPCTVDSERYAGKCITPVHIPAGGTVTLAL